MLKTVQFQTILFSISAIFCLHTVKYKTVLFQTIQLSINTQFKYQNFYFKQFSGPIYMTLSGATIPAKSAPGSDGNKWVLHISQSSSITGASLSDYLVSYPGHLMGESYSSTEIQSVYSAATAD